MRGKNPAVSSKRRFARIGAMDSSLAAIWVALGLLLVACVSPAMSSSSQGTSERNLSAADIEAMPTAFPTTYQPPATEAFQGLYESMSTMQNPGRVAKLISDMLRLGCLRIPIVVKQCGAARAHYNPNTRSITICYEFLYQANQLLGKSEEASLDFDNQTSAILVFVALHEIAHALIDVLDLPFRDSEEDLADRFALQLILQTGDESQGRLFVGTPAAFFQHHATEIQASNGLRQDDPHSTSHARAMDAACLLYGRYRDASLEQILGRRAAQCPQWYEAARGQWNKALAPYSRVRSKETL